MYLLSANFQGTLHVSIMSRDNAIDQFLAYPFESDQNFVVSSCCRAESMLMGA